VAAIFISLWWASSHEELLSLVFDLKTLGAIIGDVNPYILPTREEIRAACEEGEAAVLAVFDVLTKIIRGLEASHQAFEDQLAKNSRNSSRLPSSDGLNKPAVLATNSSQGYFWSVQAAWR
jgi:hypothetical protein